jgi:chromosome segregation ATPase
MVEKDSIFLLRQDLINHSKTISSLVEKLVAIEEEIVEFRIDRARRDERAETLKRDMSMIHDKIDRETATIKEQIKSIINLGKWILATFSAILIAWIANFIIKGGLNVP